MVVERRNGAEALALAFVGCSIGIISFILFASNDIGIGDCVVITLAMTIRLTLAIDEEDVDIVSVDLGTDTSFG